MSNPILIFTVFLVLLIVGFYLWDRRSRRIEALYLWLLAIELDAYLEMLGDSSDTFKARWREEYGNPEDYI